MPKKGAAQAPPAARHAVFCVSHWLTLVRSADAFAFAAFAHWLCCTSHERPSAAARFRKSELLPTTWKPRPPGMTGGAVIPPSAPVNVCKLPAVEAAAVVAVDAAAVVAAVTVAAAVVAATVAVASVAVATSVAVAAAPETVTVTVAAASRGAVSQETTLG